MPVSYTHLVEVQRKAQRVDPGIGAAAPLDIGAAVEHRFQPILKGLGTAVHPQREGGAGAGHKVAVLFALVRLAHACLLYTSVE